MNQMKINYINISDIFCYPKNSKIHLKDQIKKVANSIKTFGWVQPIVIDSKNEIIIGHCRFEAGKLLDLEKVPCLQVENLTKEQIKALRLADNKLNESEWNMEMVIEELGMIDINLQKIIDFDADDLGINMPSEAKEIKIEKIFQIIIDCKDENEQEQIYEQLKNMGLNPRIINV